MEHDCTELVRLVLNPPAVSEGYPPSLPHLRQPFVFRRVGREMATMALDRQTRAFEDVRKGDTEIAIREENERHAAAFKPQRDRIEM